MTDISNISMRNYSPAVAAMETVEELDNAFAKMHPDIGSGMFKRLAFDPILESYKKWPESERERAEHESADVVLNLIINMQLDTPLDINPHGKPYSYALMSCWDCVRAIRWQEFGNIDEGWRCAVRASYWLGTMEHGNRVGNLMDKALSDIARRGADAKHAENRAIKSDAKKWWEDNRHLFRSMDAAAEAMAGKVVSMSFRTVRDWIGEWTIKSAIKSRAVQQNSFL